MKKFYYSFLCFLFIFLIYSCKKDDPGPTTPNLKTDIVGTWLVTRTLVTPNQDFPNGYADQQTWTIAVSGETATVTTDAGTINGMWVNTTDTYGYPHWYFEWEGPDPRTGYQIKIIVEIIDIDPFLATNETYSWDISSQRYLLLDSFGCEGAKI